MKNLTREQIVNKIKKMKKYDISVLHDFARKSEFPLITINFWYNAIHS